MKKCPNCGKVTDSKFCPECGTNLIEVEEIEEKIIEEIEGEDSTETAEITSDEKPIFVGADDVVEVTGVEGAAQEGAVPASNTSENVNTVQPQQVQKTGSSGKKKHIGIIVAVIAVILIAVIGISASNAAKAKKAQEEYYGAIAMMRASAAVMNMRVNGLGFSLKGGIETCKDLINLTNAVWHDSIYEDPDEDTEKYISGTTDFNEALNKLYASSEVTELQSSLQDGIDLIYKEPVPDSLSEAKAAYVKVVTTYKDMVDWCDWPSGSYSTYMSSSQEKYDAFNAAYNEFDMVCPENPETDETDETGETEEAED